LEFVEIRRTIHEPGIGPDAFTSTPEWVDEWGNTNAHLMPLTSPAWKLILVTRETEHYPFPDSRHIPLGNELPPGPGEHRRLALSPTALSLGVIDAVWVGSGRFAIENGVVSSATAKPPSEGFDSVWHGPDQRYGGDIHQTALFVRFMPKSGNHTIGSVTEFRTSTGTNRAACDQTSFVHSTGITLAKFSLSQALGTNAADISFIPITPVVFEFIVTPPKP
jgi:hypothetical protein